MIKITEIATGREWDEWDNENPIGYLDETPLYYVPREKAWYRKTSNIDYHIPDEKIDLSLYLISDTDYIAKAEIAKILNAEYCAPAINDDRYYARNILTKNIAEKLGIPLSQIE